MNVSYIKETAHRISARPSKLCEDTFDLGSWIELSCLSMEIAFSADVIARCNWENYLENRPFDNNKRVITYNWIMCIHKHLLNYGKNELHLKENTSFIAFVFFRMAISNVILFEQSAYNNKYTQIQWSYLDPILNKGVKANCVFITRSHLHGEHFFYSQLLFTKARFYKCYNCPYWMGMLLLIGLNGSISQVSQMISTFEQQHCYLLSGNILQKLFDNHLIEMYSPFIKHTLW